MDSDGRIGRPDYFTAQYPVHARIAVTSPEIRVLQLFRSRIQRRPYQEHPSTLRTAQLHALDDAIRASIDEVLLLLSWQNDLDCREPIQLELGALEEA